METHPVM